MTPSSQHRVSPVYCAVKSGQERTSAEEGKKIGNNSTELRIKEWGRKKETVIPFSVSSVFSGEEKTASHECHSKFPLTRF